MLQDEVSGAQTTIYCAVAEEVIKDNGKYFSDCKVRKLRMELYIQRPQQLLPTLPKTWRPAKQGCYICHSSLDVFRKSR